MPFDTEEYHRQARDHAWSWFELHSQQRMQSFNFFLIATAFLATGYSSTINTRPVVAVVIALIGAWIAFRFIRLEQRSRPLIKAAENSLAIAQRRLSESADIPSIEIITNVERPMRGAATYHSVISTVEVSVLCVFLLGAAYAGFATDITTRLASSTLAACHPGAHSVSPARRPTTPLG